MKHYFITATDTDAGKTFFACALTHAMIKQAQLNVAVYKPISAGCELINEQLVNEDAQLLLQTSNMNQTLHQVNPIAFEPPIAPHIAAALCGKNINIESVQQSFTHVCELNPDVVITEGAGGWKLPLGKNESGHSVFLSEFAQRSQQDIILVVNMKLGCLNHAVLTYQNIIADGLRCVGWVANAQEPMPYLRENINELKNLLPLPLIAEFGSEHSFQSAADKINLSHLNLPKA